MLLESIRRIYPDLTKSQKRLADFVAGSYRQAAFMNASELAGALDLNEATVIRFAQRLGFDGYPELVNAVRELVQQELQPAAREDTQSDPLLALLSVELEDAQRFYNTVSPAAIGEVVDAMAGAARLYVVAQGLSAPLAQLLGNVLRSAGKAVWCPAVDPQSLAVMLDACDRDSLVIGLSVDDEHSELVASALHLAGQIPARTLAISRSPVSPAAQAAEIALTCPQTGQQAMPSITTMAALIDMLAQALSARNPEGIAARQRHVADTSARILASSGGR
jgi:DNA-binding MurR/RpiR family transcriptional regulator